MGLLPHSWGSRRGRAEPGTQLPPSQNSLLSLTMDQPLSIQSSHSKEQANFVQPWTLLPGGLPSVPPCFLNAFHSGPSSTKVYLTFYFHAFL